MFCEILSRWTANATPLGAALCLLGCVAAAGCGQSTSQAKPPLKESAAQAKEKPMDAASNKLALATFGGGCFWCTEAFFQQVKGVESVASGYSGGRVENPTYEAVCTGRTGHAEVIQITYDPRQVAYEDLLEIFWKTHDPTTLNRQGADSGTQYRSVVFYHDELQKELAEGYKEKLDKSGAFGKPIVTEISPYDTFYAAEDYHQDYFRQNPRQPYCAAVIRPKMEKFKQVFKDKLKE